MTTKKAAAKKTIAKPEPKLAKLTETKRQVREHEFGTCTPLAECEHWVDAEDE